MGGSLLRAAAVSVALLATAATFFAANAAGTAAFRTLVGQGYEIKAVTLVPVEVVKRDDPTYNADTVVVTLQKGGSVAACYFSFASWHNMNKASLDNPQQCVMS